MSKNVRIGIIRAQHAPGPAISDPACISLMMVGEYSVFRYWRNTTRGFLDFVDSPLFPWVGMTIGADTSRSAQAKAAVAALRARYPSIDPLAGLDGLILLTQPGSVTMPNPLAGQPGQPATVTANFDGGTTSVDGLAIAVLPVSSSNHTFMCHELGHVLGFDHSYGLDNNGADWNPSDATVIVSPVYGSPYDLMSSAAFGTRWLGTGPFYNASPTFAGPAVSGWPVPGAFSMGPHLARANLHRYMPDALTGRTIERAMPPTGGKVSARLVPASATHGKCLLVLQPPGVPASGVGRVYVEYRTARGWDAGMDLVGPDLAREGVVVHRVEDVPAVGPRVWYRGAIPTVSADRDVRVAGTGLVVAVDGVDSDGGWVDVSVTVGAAPAVEISRLYQADDFVGVIGHPERTVTPCGDPVRKGTFATATTEEFGVSFRGLGGAGPPNDPAPMITWTVAGQAVTGAAGSVWAPVDGSTLEVGYTVDPVISALRLTSRGGERFTVQVRVSVGGAAAEAQFVASGWYDGIHPEDMPALARCLRKFSERYRATLPPLRKPGPDPPWELKRRRQLEVNWYNSVLRRLDRATTLDADGRQALRNLVDLQVQPVPTLSERLAAIGIVDSDRGRGRNQTQELEFEATAEALLDLSAGRPLDRRMPLAEAMARYRTLLADPEPGMGRDARSGWNAFAKETQAPAETA